MKIEQKQNLNQNQNQGHPHGRTASLQIDNLRIRLPAGSRGTAESIAREAIDGLASALPSVTGDHQLGHARLRIRVPAGASNSEISAAIQAAIARSIAL